MSQASDVICHAHCNIIIIIIIIIIIPTPKPLWKFLYVGNDSKPPSCLFVLNRFKSFGQQISICPVLQSFLCCITHSGFYSWCLYHTSLSFYYFYSLNLKRLIPCTINH